MRSECALFNIVNNSSVTRYGYLCQCQFYGRLCQSAWGLGLSRLSRASVHAVDYRCAMRANHGRCIMLRPGWHAIQGVNGYVRCCRVTAEQLLAAISGEEDKSLRLPKDVIERLKTTVFGFDTFWVTRSVSATVLNHKVRSCHCSVLNLCCWGVMAMLSRQKFLAAIMLQVELA
jgi:hypothetical protein